jgi:hypothetical protein
MRAFIANRMEYELVESRDVVIGFSRSHAPSSTLVVVFSIFRKLQSLGICHDSRDGIVIKQSTHRFRARLSTVWSSG